MDSNKPDPAGKPDPADLPYRADVVVVGARVAGAATAMLLARHGLDVVVLDRAPEGTDTLSTHALMRAGVLQLHRWGVLDRIVAAGTPPVRQTVFRYGGDEVRVTIKQAFGVGALYAPRRTLVDGVLVDEARQAGARFHFGTAVNGVVRDRAGRVTGVEVPAEDGTTRVVHARWVVGADGIRSRIARAVDAPVEAAGSHMAGVAYGYFRGVEVEGYEWVYRQGVGAGLIPTNDGETCVFVGVPPDRYRREVVPDRLGAMVRLAAEADRGLGRRVAAVTLASPLHLFPGHPGFMKRPWGPGWALVGDSGYFKDPLGAHGMSDALRDAELLARAISSVARGEATEEEAMAHYHSTRNRLSVQLFEVIERIASFEWTTDTIPALLMELSSSMSQEVEYLAALDGIRSAA